LRPVPDRGRATEFSCLDSNPNGHPLKALFVERSQRKGRGEARQKKKPSPPFPALEGNFVEKVFAAPDSGTFGRELMGDWLGYEEVRQIFVTHIRDDGWKVQRPPGEWFDIHARLML
jgi:hypothetical protein